QEARKLCRMRMGQCTAQTLEKKRFLAVSCLSAQHNTEREIIVHYFVHGISAIISRPKLCGVTSKTPATTRRTRFDTRHNSRWYLRAISPSGEEAMCRGRPHEARPAAYSVLA